MPDLAPHRAPLLRLTRTDPDPRVRHRADALLLVADGQSLTGAARAMPTSAGRLRAWRDRFLAEGRDGLADRPRSGRPPKLDAAARALLERTPTRSPLDEGHPVTTWTVDECDLHTHPHLAKVWRRRGQPVSVPAAGADRRRAVCGALDDASGHLVWHLVWQLVERKGGDAFAAFLARVAAARPTEPLVLVRDNVGYHRSPVVRTWWARQEGRIIPFWLPACAPTLNLIERVWRFLEQKLARHRFWADVGGLEAAAATLLDRTEARFHTARPPAIRLVQDFCRSA